MVNAPEYPFLAVLYRQNAGLKALTILQAYVY